MFKASTYRTDVPLSPRVSWARFMFAEASFRVAFNFTNTAVLNSAASSVQPLPSVGSLPFPSQADSTLNYFAP